MNRTIDQTMPKATTCTPKNAGCLYNLTLL